MNYAVTGAHGQLGRAVLEVAARRGVAATGAPREAVRVEDAQAVEAWVGSVRPATVIHCAAWTDVDGCEGDPERAAEVNGAGTENVARACAEIGAALVYVSTDFVFDGASEAPYRVDDEPAPCSAYGQSKLAGERAVLAAGRDDFYVVRTSWVYGPGGRNFPAAILARARSGEPLSVVDDQVGSPTMTMDLAATLLSLVEARAPGGVYHASNEGACSWHRFAEEILEHAGMGSVPVATMSSEDLGRPAKRPAYSVLDCSRLSEVGCDRMPHYVDGLKRYLAEELT